MISLLSRVVNSEYFISLPLETQPQASASTQQHQTYQVAPQVTLDYSSCSKTLPNRAEAPVSESMRHVRPNYYSEFRAFF